MSFSAFVLLHCSPSQTLDIDPYAYTSGRWLRNDSHEREARFIRFNFDALCQRVVQFSPGADHIVDCEKKEGGFNRVFIFTMDTGTRIVARLPFESAGPAKLATASKVATIRFCKFVLVTWSDAPYPLTMRTTVQSKTNIPIPTIFDWSDDSLNSIGCEYIIMDHAPGVQLQQKWPHMAGDEKVRCVDAIYQKLKCMVDIDFPAYGSIYFANTSLNSPRYTLDDTFCIGPHCGTRYWNYAEGRYYQGGHPTGDHVSVFELSESCKSSDKALGLSLDAYCSGLIDAGLARIPRVEPNLADQPRYHGSIQAHRSLLERARIVLSVMSGDPRIQNTAGPTLFHPDLHKRNVFVSDEDPAIVTSILDWQSSSVEPAFWYADEEPDFASAATQSLSHDPDGTSSLCAQAFSVCTQFLTPKLAGPRLQNEALYRPFRYSHRTWKDGAVALRHELIETSRSWQELAFTGPCPFLLPPVEDLARHQVEHRCFEAAQNLKRDLASLLNIHTDGWVPPENWDATQKAHRAIFHDMLQAILANKRPDPEEPVRNENTLRAIWPFDLDR